MADLSATRADLDNMSYRLTRRWHEAEEVWDDAVQRDFEKRCMAPLFAQDTMAGSEIDDHIDIAPRVKIVAQDGAEKRQLGDVPAPAEVDQFLAR